MTNARSPTTTTTTTGARPLARAPLVLAPRGALDAPLAVAGVYGRGAVASDLVDALRALDDATLRMMRGVRTVARDGDGDGDGVRELVVVIGPAALLPWRDGVRYLGVLVPGLYVPTTRTTSLPASLAAEALARHLPAALIDDVVVPLRAGLPLSRAALAHPAPGTHPGRGGRGDEARG